MTSFKIITRGCLQHIYQGLIRKNWDTFLKASHSPESVQNSKLLQLMAKNAHTVFGKQHGFASIKTRADFQKAVPISDYETYEPLIQRLIEGESNVLTKDAVRIFERTSGSTSANKYIPYTDDLLKEFSSATSPWIYNIHENIPELYGTGSYWSVSQAASQREKTKSGISIGFEDDTEYLGILERWAFRYMSSVPSSVARVSTHEDWELKTLLHLIHDQELGLFSVWSPTFILRLIDGLKKRREEIFPKLFRDRRKTLQKAFYGDDLDASLLWPRLKFISCWADGPSASFIPELQKIFPKTFIQSKGLMATEGVVSFPLWNMNGSVTAVMGHYMEFLPLDEKERTIGVHELEVGGLYSPVLTTGGGLYRYHLKDIVKCVGHFNKLPLIRFEQKLDRISDFVGEKLNAQFVHEVVLELRKKMNLLSGFAMLVPLVNEQISYRLYIECDVQNPNEAARILDEALSKSHHYGYARKLGQLGPVSVKSVTNGQERYESYLVSLGMKRGNIKPSILDARPGLEKVFG